MTESTTGIAATIAVVSSLLLAVLGVDYYALLWALIAAISVQLFAEKTTRTRAAMITVVSMLLGAALGTAMAENLGAGSRPMLMLCSIVCASAPRPLIASLVNAFINRINKNFGGGGGDPPAPPPVVTVDSQQQPEKSP